MAVLLRMAMVFSAPSLSDDVFRYVWEGMLTSTGGNPYVTAPAEFSPVGDDIHQRINHSHLSSIYPPLAMWFFALLSTISYSSVLFKVAMGLADALVAVVLADCLRLRGKSLSLAWLYALHPLPIVETAGSGHLEPLAILPMMLGVWAHIRGKSGVFWLGLGALIKLLPGVLLLASLKRKPHYLVAVVLLAIISWAPFSAAGWKLTASFAVYAEHWSFNGSLFPILKLIFSEHARPIAVFLGAGCCGYGLFKKSLIEDKLLWITGGFILLSPTVHPWYCLWVWPPALLCGVRIWTWLITIVPLSYVALLSYDPVTLSWNPPLWPQLIEYTPLLLMLLYQSLKQRILPGP